MPLLKEETFLVLWSLVGSGMATREDRRGKAAWDEPASAAAARLLLQPRGDEASFLTRIRQLRHDEQGHWPPMSLVLE